MPINNYNTYKKCAQDKPPHVIHCEKENCIVKYDRHNFVRVCLLDNNNDLCQQMARWHVETKQWRFLMSYVSSRDHRPSHQGDLCQQMARWHVETKQWRFRMYYVSSRDHRPSHQGDLCQQMARWHVETKQWRFRMYYVSSRDHRPSHRGDLCQQMARWHVETKQWRFRMYYVSSRDHRPSHRGGGGGGVWNANWCEIHTWSGVRARISLCTCPCIIGRWQASLRWWLRPSFPVLILARCDVLVCQLSKERCKVSLRICKTKEYFSVVACEMRMVVDGVVHRDSWSAVLLPGGGLWSGWLVLQGRPWYTWSLP